jgi:hypothetical protein
MDHASITRYIADTFAGVEVVVASGNTFFFNDPQRKFPFATIVTNDQYDNVSNLNRPNVFRLNIGVSKQTFLALFGDESEHDFTALDQIMPHPVYGKMYWICVLNPSDATFQKLQPLIMEAYDLSVKRQIKLR